MTDRNKIQDLDLLVEELMKDQPDETLVRRLMMNLKLPYSTDPIERINKVLLKLHPPANDDLSPKKEVAP